MVRPALQAAVKHLVMTCCLFTAQHSASVWSVSVVTLHDDLIHLGLAGITFGSGDLIADYEIGLMAPAQWDICCITGSHTFLLRSIIPAKGTPPHK